MIGVDTSKMKTGEFIFSKVTDAGSISTIATKRDPAQRTLDHRCLGINSKSNPKQDNAIEWIHKNDVDVAGWQEAGISFDMFKGYESFYKRIRNSR